MAAWLPAACYIKVQSPIEVAVALKIVTFLDSKFAVRGAGHNANPGFSSIDQSGVLIDMRGLNSITLSKDKKIASVGPGTSWDKVYEYLEKQQLTVVGGRVKDVGVGGVVLGGACCSFMP